MSTNLPSPSSQPLPPGPDASTTPVELQPLWAVIKRLPAYVRLAASLARDPLVPRKSKALLAAGGAYAVSPIDLVPGIIPVAGQLDDLYVLLTGLQQAARSCPQDVIAPHFLKAGIEPSQVDDDLASIRTFVRQGAVWAFRNGGRAAAGLSRQAVALARRVRQRGGPADDQKPL